MSAPTILHLKIDRFRGLQSLDWRPAPGMNLILGSGEVGKTTIVDPAALLLSPSARPATPAGETADPLQSPHDEALLAPERFL